MSDEHPEHELEHEPAEQLNGLWQDEWTSMSLAERLRDLALRVAGLIRELDDLQVTQDLMLDDSRVRTRYTKWAMIAISMTVVILAVAGVFEVYERNELAERDRAVAETVCAAMNQNRAAVRLALVHGTRAGFEVLVDALVGEDPDPEDVAEAERFFDNLDAVLEQARDDLEPLDCGWVVEGVGTSGLLP